jgi:2-phospho-L-lactate/phosphoenolpyruvate guanylyltransferase
MLVVIPFRAAGKSRLPEELRRDVALAMLGDVVEAAVAVGETRVVTDDPGGCLVAGDLGASVVDDPGEGQGAAVAAGLADADGICLVVNADVPRVRPSDLAALAVPPRLRRVALVAAADGTTNALGLPYAEVFRPLYGPGSAARFAAHAAALGIELEGLALPNLVHDVDTLDDLGVLGPRGASRTRALLGAIAR